MALRIGEDCIACRGCVDTCPTRAIDLHDMAYRITPERCTECADRPAGPACAEACPTDCITPDAAGAESRTAPRANHHMRMAS